MPGHHRPGEVKSRLSNLRRDAVKALGGKCIRCGFDDIRALDIDHIHGGQGEFHRTINQKTGEKYYTGTRWTMYLRILEGKLRDKVQLLCANCHRIKTFENRDNRGGDFRSFAEDNKDAVHVENVANQNSANS